MSGPGTASTGSRTIAGSGPGRPEPLQWTSRPCWPSPGTSCGRAGAASIPPTSGLWQFRSGRWTREPIDPDYPHSSVPAAMALGPDGTVWAAGEGGVAYWSDGHWSVRRSHGGVRDRDRQGRGRVGRGHGPLGRVGVGARRDGLGATGDRLAATAGWTGGGIARSRRARGAVAGRTGRLGARRAGPVRRSTAGRRSMSSGAPHRRCDGSRDRPGGRRLDRGDTSGRCVADGTHPGPDRPHRRRGADGRRDAGRQLRHGCPAGSRRDAVGRHRPRSRQVRRTAMDLPLREDLARRGWVSTGWPPTALYTDRSAGPSSVSPLSCTDRQRLDRHQECPRRKDDGHTDAHEAVPRHSRGRCPAGRLRRHCIADVAAINDGRPRDIPGHRGPLEPRLDLGLHVRLG